MTLSTAGAHIDKWAYKASQGLLPSFPHHYPSGYDAIERMWVDAISLVQGKVVKTPDGGVSRLQQSMCIPRSDNSLRSQAN